MTGVTSSWASCGVGASKGTRGSDDAVPKISSGSRSLYPVLRVVCHPKKTEQLEGFGPSKAGIISTMSRPVRAGIRQDGPSSPGQANKSHSSILAK